MYTARNVLCNASTYCNVTCEACKGDKMDIALVTRGLWTIPTILQSNVRASFYGIF